MALQVMHGRGEERRRQYKGIRPYVDSRNVNIESSRVESDVSR